MNDIRKLIDILNETTVAGAVGGGPAVPLGATHKRMEETQTPESAMPEVIEYGNWENSALVTEKKTKSMRPKSKRIVKSVYGVDNTSAEGGEASESKEPHDKKKKVRESAQSVAEDQDLQEQDLIVNPAAIKKAMGIIAKDKVRTDHEVEMARSDLLATIKNAQSLYAMLKDRSEDQGLEGWVQEKLIKANDYLNAVKEYYDEKMMPEAGVAEGQNINEAYIKSTNDAVNVLANLRQIAKHIEIGTPYNGNLANQYVNDVWDVYSWLENRADVYNPQLKAILNDVFEVRKQAKALETGGNSGQNRQFANQIVNTLYPLMQWIQMNVSDQPRVTEAHGHSPKQQAAIAIAKREQTHESTCPECGGPAFSEKSIAEAKDACYHKVKSRVKVWPSAYASGQLVQCRKRGAKNWGNKSKK